MYSNILETRIPLHVFYRISEVSVKPKKTLPFAIFSLLKNS